MAVRWAQESCDRRDDPVSGARIIQLTSAAAISNNVYCEQPYGSPDGKRIAIVRSTDFCFGESSSLLVHELDTLRITMVARAVSGVFTNAWSGLIHYWTVDRRLMRLRLMTLEQEEVYVEEDPAAPLPGSSVSPDQRYVLGMTTRLTGPDSPIFRIFRLDLKEKRREVVFEHPEICNPHLQFNPVTGGQILVQSNRGMRMEKDGSLAPYRHTAQGTTLFVIDQEGGNQRYLPAGPPHTATCTGHECFIADTGRVLFSASWDARSEYDWRQDSRFPQGNLFTAAPGDEKPTVFAAPEHHFNHVCASRCARYFVADSMPDPGLFVNGQLRSWSLVVGNLQTGKYRVLVQDTQGSGGGNQCTHSHPYLTADNRYVIYNADPCYGPAQVFAARIPPGFLDSLE